MSDKNLIYEIPSLIVLNSFCFLNKQLEESLHLMSGINQGERIILDMMIPVKISHSSLGGVSADPDDNLNKLVLMDDYGFALYAVVHIHPSDGILSTHQSHIDIRYQETLERGGYKSVMGIFSRDGFLRFFRIENDFEIKIIGKGIEVIDEESKIFKIAKIEDVQRLKY
jgi:hypothetical protein